MVRENPRVDGQVDRFDAIDGARRANGEALRRHASEVPGLRFQNAPTGTSVCPAALLGDRDDFARELARERIDFRLPYRVPLPCHPILGCAERYPVAE